jgi:hypothetical protein
MRLHVCSALCLQPIASTYSPNQLNMDFRRQLVDPRTGHGTQSIVSDAENPRPEPSLVRDSLFSWRWHNACCEATHAAKQ